MSAEDANAGAKKWRTVQSTATLVRRYHRCIRACRSHRERVNFREASKRCRRIAGDEGSGRRAIVLVIFWRVGRALEHIEHLLRDEESSRDVHCGDPRRNGTKELSRANGPQSELAGGRRQIGERTQGSRPESCVAKSPVRSWTGILHLPHHVDSADGGHARDRVRHRHQRGVQRMRDSPHHLTFRDPWSDVSWRGQ